MPHAVINMIALDCKYRDHARSLIWSRTQKTCVLFTNNDQSGHLFNSVKICLASELRVIFLVSCGSRVDAWRFEREPIQLRLALEKHSFYKFGCQIVICLLPVIRCV